MAVFGAPAGYYAFSMLDFPVSMGGYEFYAYGDNPLFDEGGADSPHVIGRRPFGRISIANSDAGGEALLDAAIDEAHRAVRDIKDRASRG